MYESLYLCRNFIELTDSQYCILVSFYCRFCNTWHYCFLSLQTVCLRLLETKSFRLKIFHDFCQKLAPVIGSTSFHQNKNDEPLCNCVIDWSKFNPLYKELAHWWVLKWVRLSMYIPFAYLSKTRGLMNCSFSKSAFNY